MDDSEDQKPQVPSIDDIVRNRTAQEGAYSAKQGPSEQSGGNTAASQDYSPSEKQGFVRATIAKATNSIGAPEEQPAADSAKTPRSPGVVKGPEDKTERARRLEQLRALRAEEQQKLETEKAADLKRRQDEWQKRIAQANGTGAANDPNYNEANPVDALKDDDGLNHGATLSGVNAGQQQAPQNQQPQGQKTPGQFTDRQLEILRNYENEQNPLYHQMWHHPDNPHAGCTFWAKPMIGEVKNSAQSFSATPDGVTIHPLPFITDPDALVAKFKGKSIPAMKKLAKQMVEDRQRMQEQVYGDAIRMTVALHGHFNISNTTPEMKQKLERMTVHLLERGELRDENGTVLTSLKVNGKEIAAAPQAAPKLAKQKQKPAANNPGFNKFG